MVFYINARLEKIISFLGYTIRKDDIAVKESEVFLVYHSSKKDWEIHLGLYS
jgi:hypothetical protein